MLSAPPGYGATTAAAQVTAGTRATAWVSLDALDSTPSTLAVQLTSALAGLDSSHASTLPSLTGASDPLHLMPELMEWLHAATCEWIVIDGLDTSTHAAVLPSLAYLIANLPPQTRIIVTTHDIARRVPVDPADRRLTIIDREQLQATPDEAALIACASAPGLDVNSVEEIAAAADGWVAAIRAAARYARQHPQGHAAHWLTSQGAAALLAPWLDRLPAARRQFLLDTLALDWLAGPLCDSTLEASGSLEALEDLEARAATSRRCFPRRHRPIRPCAGGVGIPWSRRR